jgi:hypothetical protein
VSLRRPIAVVKMWLMNARPKRMGRARHSPRSRRAATAAAKTNRLVELAAPSSARPARSRPTDWDGRAAVIGQRAGAHLSADLLMMRDWRPNDCARHAKGARRRPNALALQLIWPAPDRPVWPLCLPSVHRSFIGRLIRSERKEAVGGGRQEESGTQTNGERSRAVVARPLLAAPNLAELPRSHFN